MEPRLQADKTVANSKPDSIMCFNEQGTCISIDVAIPAYRNLTKKQAEKILKYEYLIILFQRMWNVKVKVIPVITGGTGTVSK